MNTTSATEPAARAPATPLPVSYADEPRITAFVAAHDLGGWVDAAVRLAWDAFPGAKGIAVYVDGEPGTDDERLMIDVAMGARTIVAEASRQYDGFVTAWNAATPPQVTDWICLAQDLR